MMITMAKKPTQTKTEASTQSSTTSPSSSSCCSSTQQANKDCCSSQSQKQHSSDCCSSQNKQHNQSHNNLNTTAKLSLSSNSSSTMTAKSAMTTIVAKADIGWGNNLYIRGEGAGLSWSKGAQMQNNGSDEWVWTSTKASTSGITFKFLLNDEAWCDGENMSVSSGNKITAAPSF
ncbi:MAG: hypothetical protein A2Y14_05925 [Verrucomicrobia bacterium GWF2_51_19]|nr:MAG: hypothetical protein A2Y14_05925 [Verrucomicrobia bacterium GWF2_51_19]HCJ12119.1 hypothetical protein [Opitutae bacterium]